MIASDSARIAASLKAGTMMEMSKLEVKVEG
jgi:hypothetical protein